MGPSLPENSRAFIVHPGYTVISSYIAVVQKARRHLRDQPEEKMGGWLEPLRDGGRRLSN